MATVQLVRHATLLVSVDGTTAWSTRCSARRAIFHPSSPNDRENPLVPLPDVRPVAAVHMDAINHRLLTREDLRDAASDVSIPEGSERLSV